MISFFFVFHAKGGKQLKSPKKIVKEHILVIAIITSVVLIINVIFGRSCPFFLITGIECPFCGMTRAHLELFKLNFSSALSHNPLFFLGIPYLLLIFHGSSLKKRFGISYSIIIISITSAFVFLLFYRM